MTRVPRPAGRGNRMRATPVAVAARELGLSVTEVESVREGAGFDAISETRPDVIAVVAYGEVLTPKALALPKRGAINLHFSLLPELRGASPVSAAIDRGFEKTGVTTMLMDEGLDTGPILLQHEVAILADDDRETLGNRLAEAGGLLLVKTLDAIADGTATTTTQPKGDFGYVTPLGPADREIDWSRPAEALERRIRALSPEPGATSTFRARSLKILEAEVDSAELDPGTIAVAKEGLLVGTGRGGLRLTVVVPSGARKMSGIEFVRGYRPRAGERLG